MPSDKRSFKRFNLFIVVEFKPQGGKAESFWGITRNFSDEGFSFESQEFSSENGGLLECTFKQPDNQMSVSILGKIAWKEESDKFQCLTGVKFQDLNEERKDKLLAIMSAAGELPSEFFQDKGKTEVAAIPENIKKPRFTTEHQPKNAVQSPTDMISSLGMPSSIPSPQSICTRNYTPQALNSHRCLGISTSIRPPELSALLIPLAHKTRAAVSPPNVACVPLDIFACTPHNSEQREAGSDRIRHPASTDCSLDQ